MLTEQQIKALQNGEYGVTKEGDKVKFIGKKENGEQLWVCYNKDGIISHCITSSPSISFSDNVLNIVGLWEDKPEPFDLERALAGEPILLKNGYKAFVLSDIREIFPNEDIPLIGVDHRSIMRRWKLNGENCISNEAENLDIIGMWKEPEPIQPSADDLPKPIREFGDLEKVWEKVWVINFSVTRVEYFPAPLYKREKWVKFERIALKNGLLYKSKEDCQAVCDWLMSR